MNEPLHKGFQNENKNKMDNKKIIIGCMFLVFGIFLISLISAEVSSCCEKTLVRVDGTGGMWCQNDAEENCNTSFKIAPTSCESTSYCRKGCCYSSKEGTCTKNTPQQICEQRDGVWSESKDCDIPQCELGCCLIGEQAAFVTQTKCKRMSSLYGLKISFRKDITSEIQCIASARSGVRGACVFEQEFERTCLILTQEECANKMAQDEGVEFYEGHLCSDPALLTNCGYPGKTVCVEGKDQVYFTDTCGNLANIYDIEKINDTTYWSEMKSPAQSCDYDENNANDAGCGNCDYLLGSTCKAYEREKDESEPNYGDYICRDLGCQEGDLAEEFYDINERYPEHGETWCSRYGGVSIISAGGEPKNTNSLEENVPGSRYFRLACYNGEITVEPCADYRQQICIEGGIEVEGDIGVFKTAICRVNRWQDCVAQKNQKDCENTDKRDCKWGGTMVETSVCIPRYAPGFDFWESEQDAEDMCNIGSAVCKARYEYKLVDITGKGGGGEWKCVENCNCENEAWAEAANAICVSLGDCGASINYIGEDGYYDIIPDLYKISSKLKKEKAEEALTTATTT